jgi:signal transduction histidine kinase
MPTRFGRSKFSRALRGLLAASRLPWLIAALGATMLVPLVGVMLHFAEFEKDAAIKGAFDDAALMAERGAERQRDIIDAASNLLTVLSRLPQVREPAGDPAACGAMLSAAASLYPWISSLFVSAPDGEQVCINDPTIKIGNISDRAYFKRALEDKQVVVSDLLTGRASRAPRIFAALPMLNSRVEVSGVIGVGIDVTAMTQVLSIDITNDDDTMAVLLDGQGRLLARAPAGGAMVGDDYGDRPLFQALKERRSGTAELPALDGSERLFGWRRVGDSSAILAVGILKSDIIARVNQLLYRRMVEIGVAVLIVSAMGLLGGELLVFGPLRELARTAKRLGAGDSSSRVRLPIAVGEMIQLGHAFNRMAADLGERQAKLIKADRAKSEFLANMSHELRTPLNSVIGFAEIIGSQAMGPVGDAAYVEYAEHIRESGRHLLGLINDILDLSKVEAGRMELVEDTVDFGATIRGAVGMLQDQAEKAGVQLICTVPKRPIAVRADSQRLRQVVLNLVSNAIKFTDAGGRVTTEIAIDAESRPTLAVEDTGIGIAAEDLPRVMEVFGQVQTQLNRTRSGTGIGLPLTKRLVEMHGGTLDLASQPGIGTTVTVRLPASRLLDAETQLVA